MSFERLLTRANLKTIQAYLRYEVVDWSEDSKQTYEERLKAANQKATEFFEEHYTDLDEYDKIAGYFGEITEVYEDVFFEIGMIVGAKLAFELRGKMKELE